MVFIILRNRDQLGCRHCFITVRQQINAVILSDRIVAGDRSDFLIVGNLDRLKGAIGNSIFQQRRSRIAQRAGLIKEVENIVIRQIIKCRNTRQKRAFCIFARIAVMVVGGAVKLYVKDVLSVYRHSRHILRNKLLPGALHGGIGAVELIVRGNIINRAPTVIIDHVDCLEACLARQISILVTIIVRGNIPNAVILCNEICKVALVPASANRNDVGVGGILHNINKCIVGFSRGRGGDVHQRAANTRRRQNTVFIHRHNVPVVTSVGQCAKVGIMRIGGDLHPSIFTDLEKEISRGKRNGFGLCGNRNREGSGISAIGSDCRNGCRSVIMPRYISRCVNGNHLLVRGAPIYLLHTCVFGKNGNAKGLNLSVLQRKRSLSVCHDSGYRNRIYRYTCNRKGKGEGAVCVVKLIGNDCGGN